MRYSLGHLKSRDKQTYLAILDSIVMGPSHISANEAEALLNINSYLFKWVMWEQVALLCPSSFVMEHNKEQMKFEYFNHN